MTKDEALTLEALKYAVSKGYGRIVQEMKIAPFTIKYDEALAQPAQEPWREFASDYERGVIDGRQKQAQSSVDKAVNRMAQRQPLTDEQIEDIAAKTMFPINFARAIEAAHGIKENT